VDFQKVRLLLKVHWSNQAKNNSIAKHCWWTKVRVFTTWHPRNSNKWQWSSSHKFADFAFSYGFHHITSSPCYPQSNGQAERVVQTVKKLLGSSDNPYLALLTYHATPMPWCNLSPLELYKKLVMHEPSCYIRQQKANRGQREPQHVPSATTDGTFSSHYFTTGSGPIQTTLTIPWII